MPAYATYSTRSRVMGYKGSSPEKKRRNQALAEELYPGRRIVRETADAFLLAEYGRRFHQ